MEERYYINRILELIEEKIKPVWGDRHQWTDKHYKKIREQIISASNIQISTNTLKRLFGQGKNRRYIQSTRSHKNALAIYLGFKTGMILFIM